MEINKHEQGFTEITEAFVKQSENLNSAADVMAQNINLILSKIVEIILDNGGDVINYAGNYWIDNF